MLSTAILTPILFFADKSGAALDYGQVFIGLSGLEARSAPKASFFDAASTIPTGTATGAAIKTRAGLPVNNSGAPSQIFTQGSFSITVLDKMGAVVYTSLKVTGLEETISAISQAALNDGLWLDTVALLTADTTLTYTAGMAATVVAGDYVQTRAEGFSYKVASSAASDHNLITAGGVKLYVIADQENIKAWAASATMTLDNTASIQAALDNGSGEVNIPEGVWRVDSPIRIHANTRLHLDKRAQLLRSAAHSANTGPVVYLLESYSQLAGGSLKTENAHADGVLKCGHESQASAYNAHLWHARDIQIFGTNAAGNRGIKLENSQLTLGDNYSNYFGRLSNIDIFGADIGVELLEICNGHMMNNIMFWSVGSAAYQFRGATENTVSGGFVHAASPGIYCIKLLNKLSGPHHSQLNQFYNIAFEPVSGGFESPAYIESGCDYNVIHVSSNTANQFVDANGNNDVFTNFASRFGLNKDIGFGSINVAKKSRLGNSVREQKTGLSAAENATVPLFEFVLGNSGIQLLRVTVSMRNYALDRWLVVDETYSIRRTGYGNPTITKISGGRDVVSAADTFSWGNSGGKATGRISTFNNGTTTSNIYSVSVTYEDETDGAIKSSMTWLV